MAGQNPPGRVIPKNALTHGDVISALDPQSSSIAIERAETIDNHVRRIDNENRIPVVRPVGSGEYQRVCASCLDRNWGVAASRQGIHIKTQIAAVGYQNV